MSSLAPEPAAPSLLDPYIVLASGARRQGRFADAAGWLDLCEGELGENGSPVARLAFHSERGLLELARGRDREALASFRAAERLAALLVPGGEAATRIKARILETLAFAGATDLVETILTQMDKRQRDAGEVRVAAAILRILGEDPASAAEEIEPVVRGADLDGPRSRLPAAFGVEAIARDILGDREAAHQALERALDLGEPAGSVLWLRLQHAPGLLERHVRSGTSHPLLVGYVLSLLGEIV